MHKKNKSLPLALLLIAIILCLLAFWLGAAGLWAPAMSSATFSLLGVCGFAGLVVLGLHCLRSGRRHGSTSCVVQAEDFIQSVAVSPAVLWITAADGRCLYLSQQWQNLTGQTPVAAQGFGWLEAVHPDERDSVRSLLMERNQQREPFRAEYRLQSAHGDYRWVIDAGNPRWASDGRFLGMAGTIFDIHEQKLVAAELVRARQQADEANEAKSRFVAHMSHELRSPMNSVLGYADLLLERQLSENDRLAYASSIKASGAHLLAIIDDVLDLSKVVSGEFKVDRQRLLLRDLMNECVRSMAVLAQRKNLELQVIFASPVPAVIESDPMRLRQILLNLLSNAVKFTDSGRIVVRLKWAGGKLLLAVEDTGLGIAGDQADRLFQAFYQIDARRQHRVGGTGLGLYLSRRLAEALGGELELQWSVPGAGSSFLLSVHPGELGDVPYIQSLEQDSPREPESSVTSLGRSFHVLLAEDSIDNQILIKIFLKKCGAEVDVASNGAEALSYALNRSYDIVLMDMMMPVMDGLEATRRLRAAGFRNPIIALTAHALQDEINRSLAAGCNRHLSKPVHIDLLSQTIEQLLTRPPLEAQI